MNAGNGTVAFLSDMPKKVKLVSKLFMVVAIQLFIINPLHAWTVVKDFNVASSKVGTKAEGNSGFDGAAGKSFYTTKQVKEGSAAAELNIGVGQTAWGTWGGAIDLPTPLRKDQEVWVSLEMFIPNDFEISTNTGSLKFVRLRFKSPEGKHEGSLDNLIRMQNQTSGVMTLLKEDQMLLAHYGERGQDDIPIGQWVRFEMYTYLHNVPKAKGGKALVRAWLNGKLLTEEERVRTISESASYMDGLFLFTYWNGGAPKTQSMYVDNIIITSDTPSNRDKFGNPMIGEFQKSAEAVVRPQTPGALSIAIRR